MVTLIAVIVLVLVAVFMLNVACNLWNSGHLFTSIWFFNVGGDLLGIVFRLVVESIQETLNN